MFFSSKISKTKYLQDTDNDTVSVQINLVSLDRKEAIEYLQSFVEKLKKGE